MVWWRRRMVERRWEMGWRRGMGSGGGAGFGDELRRGDFEIEEGCFYFFSFSLDEVNIFGILQKTDNLSCVDYNMFDN
jgi:hypothetical protein